MNGVTKTPIRKGSKLMIIFAAFTFAGAFGWFERTNVVQNTEASTLAANKKKKSRAAFNEAVRVFFSPRCTNCHPAGDSPLQGDAGRSHDPEMLRGTEGRGTEDLQCNMCHLDKNTEGDPSPPGVPDWHMPSAAQKMIFQGLTAGQLCRNLKDPLKNGGNPSAKKAVEHIANDPKVLWAWSPGNKRTTPPLSHADFIKKMNEWVANGAACPD